MMRRAWLVAVAVLGCAKVPGPPAVLDKPALVTHAIDNDVVTVNGPGYQVEFPPDGVVRMPRSIAVAGEGNLLGTNDCPFESLVGVALYPTLVASATQVPATPSTLDAIMDGPAIVKVAVRYDVESVCDATPRHLTGTTLFSFFPTGRINREDVMVVPTTTTISSGASCEECGGPATGMVNDFFFTTYWMFDDTAMFVTPAGGQAPPEPAPHQGCAMIRGRPVGVSWRTDNQGPGPRIQNGAYIHDWVRRQTGPLVTQTRTAVSDLALSDRLGVTCGEVLLATREVPLAIDGVQVPPGRDGIYRDPESHDESFDIELANPQADGAMSHGFAISLDIGEPSHLKIRRSTSGITDAFRLQPDPADEERTILWFEDGLEPGETISIEVD